MSKSEAKEDTTNEIPADMTSEILARLPVVALLRFKCVSQAWLALITSASFVAKHLKASSSNRTPNLLSVRWPSIVGSCDGLVCNYEDGVGIIWNPATRETKVMPPCSVQGSETQAVGFGFDCIENDYKVCVIHLFKTDDAGLYNDTEGELENESEAEAQAVAEIEASDTEGEVETGSEAEAEIEAGDTEGEVEIGSEAGSEAEAEIEAGDTEGEVETGSEAEAEAETETQANDNANADADAADDIDDDPAADKDYDSNSDSDVKWLKIEVYSLRLDSWKLVTGYKMKKKRLFYIADKVGVHNNGVISWVAYGQRNDPK
ncbi:hypothetical protein FEM48_Zijuj02G0129100 [Ziziphus jujuba var. spinosa]|uniref:F-box domain-containing protein n=1 Tax=Ziziphus jujuba var. spinosa TaxID=714518 RepID=A0A978VVU9_ZIZJJ|nr:hypothetical protein FEM48_Zijuj02G0129100 [Ziziphus jujuba var. spinosa]